LAIETEDFIPEVEILGHINLFEYIHETLFLCRFLHFVIKADWDDVRVFTVVEIVPSEESDYRSLRY
jgi:hypothetical protein